MSKVKDAALYFSGRHELISLLIYSGLSPALKDNFSQTPLHLAALKGDLSCVRLLCQQVSSQTAV